MEKHLMGEIELLVLAKRVEKLDMWCEATDLAIAEWCYRNGAVAGVNYDPQVWIIRNGGEFTGSLDAAETLVPEGHGWVVSSPLPKPRANVWPISVLRPIPPKHVTAATPALALCAAALRARASITRTTGDGDGNGLR